ncbi:GNAT family N-acetyltransferase [Hazenella coriacea]|uniref:Acetyltransferase (GNAT) family protein n=1 Tax=Hazenella coriacea TaxID=1179467 RepID=A0A4R3L122_9BACL|nr:GNAT family N-acetyltransferase [Hazenella coriacea]TCS93231.1 acetyltransferase (GNAT) family protein [Hazenella coriacea]
MLQYDQISIKELVTENDWKEAFPVMKQLRTHLNEETYISLVHQAKEENEYKLWGLYEENNIKAVIGFMPMVTLYNGRFIWICDLVTDSNERSKGYGEQLLTFTHEWALANDYHLVSLSSGLQRKNAHRFYKEKMNYEEVSYVFLKKLDE